MADQFSHDTTDRLAGRAHEAVDRTAEKAGRAEERIREGKEHLREQSRDYMSSLDAYVRENPMTSLGIAFVAGVIISALTRR